MPAQHDSGERGADQAGGVQSVLDLGLLRPGSVVVLDDFTPSAHWPPQFDGAVDQVRLDWLEHPMLICHEIAVAPDHAALVAVLRPHEHPAVRPVVDVR